MKELGIECIVVNAAYVPTTDKERKRKDDKRDARKLCRELIDGKMKAIYVPEPAMEHARSLVRQRGRLVKDQTRCKNRIKHLLMFSGLTAKSENERWSKKYIKELLQLDCGSPELKSALYLAIEEYQNIRKVLMESVVLIKKLSKQERALSSVPSF